MSLKERALACTVVMSSDVAGSFVVPNLLQPEINVNKTLEFGTYITVNTLHVH